MRPVPGLDDEQILLLRAALLDGEDAVAAWEAWMQTGGGLDRQDQPSFRLLPLLYRNLLALGVDTPAMSKLRGVYRYAWYRNQSLFHDAAAVIRDLTEAGVETLALKGAALTALYYQDSGTRPMDDFDLLVRPRDLEPALGVLRAGGWTGDHGLPFERLLVVDQEIEFKNRAGHQLDLHWRPLHQPASDDSFWALSVPIEVHFARTRALCAEHQLIHVCVHAVWHDAAPVRWVADALTVIKATGETLDWDVVVKEARERHLTVAMHATLRFLAQSLGAPVPSDALVGLARARAGLGQRLAYRAWTSGENGRGRIYAIEWFRYRGLRQIDPNVAPKDFLLHMQYVWGLTSRLQVLGRLARKLVQVARYGYWHPSGDG